MSVDTAQHPCFNAGVRATKARVHLPVADKCNVQCNFCNRKYDCMNESRPGVTSALLHPEQALDYLNRVMARVPNISVAGIAGPGDPFANPQRTLQTLRLVRSRYDDLILCVASNGLNVAPYLDEIADAGVNHFTVTVNAIDPAIGARVYSWVRPHRISSRGVEAASILLERQEQAIRGLKARGITVKVNTIVIPGINDGHIPAVAQAVAGWGADVLNCMPLCPTADTVFENIPQPTASEVEQVRRDAGAFLPQMAHCTRCRSDAVGLLGHDRSGELAGCLSDAASALPASMRDRPYVAVASWEGMLVNQHLGEASQLWIFQQTPDGYTPLGTREAPAPGQGPQRWLDLAELLHDCRAVLVSGIGPTPRQILAVKGVQVIEMEGVVEEGLDVVYTGADPRGLRKRPSRGCGEGCSGTGQGCG